MFVRVVGSLTGLGLAVVLTKEKLLAGEINRKKSTRPLKLPIENIHEPSRKWDFNWDFRDPAEIYSSKEGPIDQCQIPNRSRHVYLIRHGQYKLQEPLDKDKSLTELGRKQATLTGKRLKELGVTFDTVFISTMTRAQETADLILNELPAEQVRQIRHCSFLPEGKPIPPIPTKGGFIAPQIFFVDGARIEAAFRKYFHRAKPEQNQTERVLLVCHANVIRYFLCRVLQLPPEAWLNFSLKHGSITHIEIMPNGKVVARFVGDSGFMPNEMLTTS